VLFESANKSVSKDVEEQITGVIMAYGVETSFQLDTHSYQNLSRAIREAKNSGGSMSILGSLYGKSGELFKKKLFFFRIFTNELTRVN
jgi:hypothetical protein